VQRKSGSGTLAYGAVVAHLRNTNEKVRDFFRLRYEVSSSGYCHTYATLGSIWHGCALNLPHLPRHDVVMFPEDWIVFWIVVLYAGLRRYCCGRLEIVRRCSVRCDCKFSVETSAEKFQLALCVIDLSNFVSTRTECSMFIRNSVCKSVSFMIIQWKLGS
jgi:hypothetical protein